MTHPAFSITLSWEESNRWVHTYILLFQNCRLEELSQVLRYAGKKP